MALTDDILFILSNYPGGYKLMRARLRGYTGLVSSVRSRQKIEVSNETLYVTLARLKKNELVKKDKQTWAITAKGLEFLKSLKRKERRTKQRPKVKNIIISFDIPEKLKSRRNWLRKELVTLDFLMIQKSVWFGPAPLPKEFVERLHSFKLLEYIKFFRASKRNIV